MNNKNLLLVFVKNPKKGTVKTRLAKTVGDKYAYQIYLKLLAHTIEVANQVNALKQIWYSSFIDNDDGLGGDGFGKELQKGENLGERMAGAFKKGFEKGFEKILIIGSDCPGISSDIIEKGFDRLDRDDVIIGPSEDGGYYLIGSNKFIPEIFDGIPWSTEDVYPETVKILQETGLSYSLLPALNDIDTEDDLKKSNFDA